MLLSYQQVNTPFNEVPTCHVPSDISKVLTNSNRAHILWYMSIKSFPITPPCFHVWKKNLLISIELSHSGWGCYRFPWMGFLVITKLHGLFKVPRNSMELFHWVDSCHGIPWNTKLFGVGTMLHGIFLNQRGVMALLHLWCGSPIEFYGIPWHLPSSMGILWHSFQSLFWPMKVPCNSIGFVVSSMELPNIPWNCKILLIIYVW